MQKLESFAPAANVAVIGASGGLGRALCDSLSECPSVSTLHALARTPVASANTKTIVSAIDTSDENSIQAAAIRTTSNCPLDLVIVATGALHRDAMQPEKCMAEIDAANLASIYRTNTIGPAMVAKHFLPRLHRARKTVFAVLSARVGSISDNRLGGWYAYRASKAALNMLVKTLSIEHARRWPQSTITALHPGTVDTALSQPFTSRVPDDQLFSAEFAAGRLLHVIDNLDPEDTGGFFAWDGSSIAW